MSYGPGPRRIVYARKAWLTNEIHGKDGGLRGRNGLAGWLVGWWVVWKKNEEIHELH